MAYRTTLVDFRRVECRVVVTQPNISDHVPRRREENIRLVAERLTYNLPLTFP